MGETVPATPPERAVTAQDLSALADWLPPTAATLIAVLGAEAAMRLLRGFPGAQFIVPVRSAANMEGALRWAELAEAVGEEVMPRLCAHWGGQLLDVPVCRELLQEKRARWIRGRFDFLTLKHAPRLSSSTALRVINIALARAHWPLTLREVQKVVNEPPRSPPRFKGQGSAGQGVAS